jgi:hypothetical protein
MNIDPDAKTSTAKPPGTLLPFSNYPSYYAECSGFRMRGVPSSIHESIRTWIVLQSGQVRMPRACVISSRSLIAQLDDIPLIPAGFTGIKDDNAPFLHGYQSKYIEKVHLWFDLHAWTKNQPTDTYALLIEYRHIPTSIEEPESITQGSGIILERTISGSLVKRAHFVVNDENHAIDLGLVQTLDWIVD